MRFWCRYARCIKDKEPALTAKISLEGRLAAVVLDGGHGVRYSKQLPKDGRSFPGSAAKCNRSGWNDTGGADCGGGMLWIQPFYARQTLFSKRRRSFLSVGRSRTVFSMISEERPGWLIELLSHKQLPDKIVTDETLVYTALEDLYGSGASGIEKKLPAAAADSVERFGKELRSCRRHEMSGNFVLQRQPTEPVCTLWACREAGRSAFEARLAKTGGYLVIEPTEALTVIDVNTGKYDGSKMWKKPLP